MNAVLNRTGASACCWLLFMAHVCFVLNYAFNFAVNNVPLTAAIGSTCDISLLLRFRFYQPLCYERDDSSFPSDSTEEYRQFVGMPENADYGMTFKILTSDANKVLHCSNVRPADDPASTNLRAEPLAVSKVVKSLSDDVDNSIFEEPPLIDEDSNNPLPQPEHRNSMPMINPLDLVGRSFL